MLKLLVVGIGAGNPEHITVQAINALNRADVLFVPLKGESKAELAELRREIIARYVTAPTARIVTFELPVRDAANPSYADGVGDWHDAIARLYVRLIADELGAAGTGAFLVWGDPSLYDSTLRILERVSALGAEFALEVIPGISSLHALTAAHAMTLNRVGEPVLLTTGRRLSEAPLDGDAAVILDGRLAFNGVDGAAYDIFWCAYLGTPDEILIAGRLADVAAEIAAKRAEARARHGWIMDIYLLRRCDGAPLDDNMGPAE
jgi:precorrin-6A synthase